MLRLRDTTLEKLKNLVGVEIFGESPSDKYLKRDVRIYLEEISFVLAFMTDAGTSDKNNSMKDDDDDDDVGDDAKHSNDIKNRIPSSQMDFLYSKVEEFFPLKETVKDLSSIRQLQTRLKTANSRSRDRSRLKAIARVKIEQLRRAYQVIPEFNKKGAALLDENRAEPVDAVEIINHLEEVSYTHTHTHTHTRARTHTLARAHTHYTQ